MNLAVTYGIERKIRAVSSIAYAVSLMVSVVFFECQISFLSQGKFIVLSAYVSAVLFAGLIGYKISHWYFPVENLQPKLEVFLVPIAVVFMTSFFAGLSLGVTTEVSQIGKGFKLIKVFQLGFISGAMFMVIAWPALLFSTITTSILIVDYQKKLLINRSSTADLA